MEVFIARPSRWRTALLLLGAAGFVALGAWMLGGLGPAPVIENASAGKVWLVSWAAVLFFGLCAGALARRLFDQRDVLRIDAAGILYPAWSDEVIAWDDITDVGEWSQHRQRVIVLRLRDPERYPASRPLARMTAGVNRGIIGGDIAIGLTGSDASPDAAMAAILRHIG
ncbi:hypothetical protein GTZ99_08975 [Novosphingobium sp. FSY-8]|uniref:PH domain-containing protein n=1 Tax=Novosphingobium ovatum TaxID=1908523 RepID=A0ABW9XDR6_9SPHN|nr:STM3941 family protein [Novosphingobium ovatum]NBC36688.1 hypothetical protein [Novosphingobium ovatum]